MSTSAKTEAFKAYVIQAGLVLAGTYLLVLTLNYLVDPLWYFQGNQLTHKNFAFNERQAKLNQLLRAPSQYDCLIFGSSRTTLLPASAFNGYHCFNLSFSGGQIEDFIAYAEYLHHAGMRPRQIIVGVDGFNFLSGGRDAPTIPYYVLQKQPPPKFLKTYLSIDSLRMSWRTLTDQSPMPRYYDKQFEVQLRPDAPLFMPEKSLEGEGRRRTDAEERRKRKYLPDNAVLYQELVNVFPEARAIGYVPPISAWHVREMEKNGVLSGYIDALFKTALMFSVFIDYSAPAPTTWRTDITYDGSHYAPSINRQIASDLQSNASKNWGINLKKIEYPDYTRLYKIALNTSNHAQAHSGQALSKHD